MRSPAPFLFLALTVAAQAQVERVWLAQREVGKLVVCAETTTAAPVTVKTSRADAEPAIARDQGGTLHHVEVSFADDGAPLRYEVSVEGHPPVRGESRPAPTSVWRVAVVADWGYANQPDFTALRRDLPHLLVTAGDNVPSQHQRNGVGVLDGTRAYAALIDSQPELFRSTPFLPALGNHDHEIRPRGPVPPAEPVYELEATAFRRFFALPEPGWCWRFDHPRFGARLLALDLHHTSDFGTTWQTGHDFAPGSEQMRWFAEHSAAPGARTLVTLQNERNATMRAKPGWGELFARSTAVITGFGYFAERAEPAHAPPYFNTSLGGQGAKYPDPASKFFASKDNYVLLTFPADGGPLVVELKALDGRVLDRTEWPAKP